MAMTNCIVIWFSAATLEVPACNDAAAGSSRGGGSGSATSVGLECAFFAVNVFGSLPQEKRNVLNRFWFRFLLLIFEQ